MPATTGTVARAPHADGLRELANRIRAEYTEMPGLSVTLPQAQRLWALDRRTCEAVMNQLMATGVIRVTTKGRFIRA
jgi:hypothetical protein